jgi:hypothetical protein
MSHIHIIALVRGAPTISEIEIALEEVEEVGEASGPNAQKLVIRRAALRQLSATLLLTPSVCSAIPCATLR